MRDPARQSVASILVVGTWRRHDEAGIVSALRRARLEDDFRPASLAVTGRDVRAEVVRW
jgi:hypothetical protein